MKQGLSELVYILDMSGSMAELTSDTIGGYNAMIEEQKKADGDAFVTTVLFDDRYIVLLDRVPIAEVPKITDKEYAPRGMTAMLDAVGRTINSIGQQLAAMPEEERPSTVSVTIITDGYENASQEFTWKTVQSMIKEQREKYSWIFSFIGANIDVEKVSEDLGIDRKMAKAYTASAAGTDSVYQSLSKAQSKMRNMRASLRFSIQEAEDAMSEELDDIE